MKFLTIYKILNKNISRGSAVSKGGLWGFAEEVLL